MKTTASCYVVDRANAERVLKASEPLQLLAAPHSEPSPPGPLKTYVQRYIELHQTLGKQYQTHSRVLLDLNAFLQARDIPTPKAVTPELAKCWIDTMTCSAYTRIHKARFAARFFDHLRCLGVVATNPITPALLSEGRLPPSTFRPFIFTEEQVAEILAKARRLPQMKVFPLRPQTCYTMIALLYALGLRHGEARRLRVRDLDLARQTLFIEQTKFHKSRYVPFGPKVARCLEQYLAVRRTILQPLQEDDLLFVTLRRAPMGNRTLLDAFRAILHALNITGTEGQADPRLHDLRHSFAVQRLLRWYRDGVDVQNRLPALSTFMGHVDPQSTQVYLTITTDLLREASARFHQHFGRELGEEVQP
jgi:integrase